MATGPTAAVVDEVVDLVVVVVVVVVDTLVIDVEVETAPGPVIMGSSGASLFVKL